MNKALSIFLLGGIAITTQASENDLCSGRYSGISCSKLLNSGNGYSKKIGENVEHLLINNKKSPELSNIDTLIFYYTLPSEDGSVPSSNLTIKDRKINLALDQNEGGRIRQNSIGPYSHLKLIATQAGDGEINGLRIGIGDTSIAPLQTDLKNQYLQSGSLEASMEQNGDLNISGLIYMGNGSSLNANIKGKINFNSKMQNSITYPKTRYYVGNETDEDSFAYEFYNDISSMDNPKDDTAIISQNINLNLTSTGFNNSGWLYISGAASNAKINLSANSFENGVFTQNPDYIQHHSASIIDALNNISNSINSKPFTEQLNWKEGRIFVSDYATFNIIGNVENGLYGNILLIDGGVLNINGNFTNNGWLLSGAIDTKDFGYINVNGTSELKENTQIAIITNPNKPVVGNKAYLILKSAGGITETFSKKDLDSKSPNNTGTNNIIHLFNATNQNGSLINVSESYIGSNLVFDTAFSNDNKEFYVILKPSQVAKTKSVQELIKEASNQAVEQKKFQENKKNTMDKKIALQKLLEQQSINEQKLQEYKIIAEAEFMNEKLQSIQKDIDIQEQELKKLKPAYDLANAQKAEELKGVPFKDQVPIRKKYNSHPDIKAYQTLENRIRDAKYTLEDIKDALPEKNTQKEKITKLEEIKNKYEASSSYNPVLLEKIFNASNSYINALDNAMRDTIEGLKFFATDKQIDILRKDYDTQETKKYSTFEEFLNAQTQINIEKIIPSLEKNQEELKQITEQYTSFIDKKYKRFEELVKDFREKRSNYREEKVAKQAELANNKKAAQNDFDAIIGQIKNAPTPEIKNLQEQLNNKQKELQSNTEYQKLLQQQNDAEKYSDEWYDAYDKIEALAEYKAINKLEFDLNKAKRAQANKKFTPEDILNADESTLKSYAEILSAPKNENDNPDNITSERLKEYAKLLLDANIALNGDYQKGIKSGGTLLNEELQKKLSELGKETVAKLEEITNTIESIRNKKEEFINNLLVAQNQNSNMKRKMDILNGIKNLSDEIATSLIAHIKDEATLQHMVDAIEENIDDLSTQTKNNSISKTVNLISSTLTQNRLALQSNPFSTNNPIARAILKLSKERYVLDENIQMDTFDALQEAFSKEEDQTMDIWASAIGGYAQANGNSIIYGGSIGYDMILEESLILGFFGTYAYAKSNNQGNITAKSHNAQIGVYSRYFRNQHEFDVNISHNIGFVNQNRIMQIASITSTQNSDYINQSTNVSLSYGYAFDAKEDSNFYIKPLIGISGTYNIQGNYEEKGLRFEQIRQGHFTFDTNVAIEFRKYFKNGGYFYVIPGIDYLAYNSQKTITHKLGGIEIISPVEQPNKIYYTAMAGGELKINKSFFAFGSLGAKIASNEQYYNGSVGMRYKF
ncbi:autotransporter domain-containing protein [Helicobacter cappadocius]|uniref:Autotransporter domain-containing protein n=1 Tax=Helicobacter cappadocius TaxID=3063998 RepID=A0AA90PY87_9HELI|nr:MULTISPECIES: autotransporter domain-containing protein [unclassified Helicobacter]MDO7253116.1 autotransporter domain-containing protein [Helicobacter sp. faydin-H75]MDP2538758.1 autotransporter domain-containing protein [Helicobacter sp. faydin-H76]